MTCGHNFTLSIDNRYDVIRVTGDLNDSLEKALKEITHHIIDVVLWAQLIHSQAREKSSLINLSPGVWIP